MSAPTGTETTHTGHERDVDLSVFLTLKSAKINDRQSPSAQPPPPVGDSSIRRKTVEFDWRNTGDYVSVADVIAEHSSAPPPLGKSRAIDSLGAASALSCSPTERSTEED